METFHAFRTTSTERFRTLALLLLLVTSPMILERSAQASCPSKDSNGQTQIDCTWVSDKEGVVRCELTNGTKLPLVVFLEPFFAMGGGGERSAFDSENSDPVPWAPENIAEYAPRMEDGNCAFYRVGQAGSLFKPRRVGSLAILPERSSRILDVDLSLIFANVAKFEVAEWCVRVCMPIRNMESLRAAAESSCTKKLVEDLRSIPSIPAGVLLGGLNNRPPALVNLDLMDHCDLALGRAEGELVCSSVLALK